MARYSASDTATPVAATSSVLWNLKASTTDRVFIQEVGIFIETATNLALTFTLQRMNAVGTGAITSASSEKEDSAEGAATGLLEKTWASSRPTVLTPQVRRIALPVTAGSGIILPLQYNNARGFTVPLSGGLCVVQNSSVAPTATGLVGVYIVWDE